MNFAEAEAYLYSLGNEVETMKLGLENITTLLAAVGDPQTKYRKVQVAGTNGKGSVCAFLDSILGEAGIRRGLYTSPHLISITERIRIDGVDISEEEFARLATRVRETSESLVAEGRLERVPTYFEQVTAMALIAFAEGNVKLAILETGLGGRYDAVTAARAEIAAITRIDLDHQEYLGDTIEEIAAEKAAIIRGDSIVCVGAQSPEVARVVAEQCRHMGVLAFTLSSATWQDNFPGYDITVGDFRGEEIVLALKGRHQVENAALAVLTAQQLNFLFPLSSEAIWVGLETARHPGRLELVSGRPNILFDGAHNPGGADTLGDFLTKNYSDACIAFVFGGMNDKDHSSMLGKLLPFATDLILTKPDNSRAVEPSVLVRAVPSDFNRGNVLEVLDVRTAFESALEIAATYPSTKPSLVVVTGSLYLVGEVKKILNN